MHVLHRLVKAFLPVVLVAVASGGVLAQKGKPQPPEPPPNPLVLAEGLNIVTREINGGDRVRVYSPETPGVTWTLDGETPVAFGLADYDGDDSSELVMVSACSAGTKKNPLYRVFLRTYENGEDGPVYDGKCLENQSFTTARLSMSSSQVVPTDLNGDGFDDIVLGTETTVTVFYSTGTGFAPVLSVDINQLGIAPAALIRRSLAVGDVDDDDAREIVIAASYTADSITREYLLVFDSNLVLKGVSGLFSRSEALTDFCVDYRSGIAVGDTDGNGVNEVWVSGWTNHFEMVPTRYHQRVFSWTVGYEDGVMVLTDGPGLDFGLGDSLGPRLAVGRLSSTDPALIALSRVAGQGDDVLVYRNTVAVGPELLASAPYPDAEVSVHQPTIVGQRLIVAGTLLAGTRDKPPRGVFIDVLALDSDFGLQSTWSWSAREGYELWTYAAGFGLVPQ